MNKTKTKHLHVKNLCITISNDTLIEVDAHCSVEYSIGQRGKEMLSNTIDSIKIDGTPLFSDEDELAEIIAKALFIHLERKL